MPLIPKVAVVSQTSSALTLKDDTGVYNATTNPGGYGTPNKEKADVTNVFLYIRYLGDVSPGLTILSGANVTAYLNAGYELELAMKDGIYEIQVFVVVPGTNTITMSNISDEFALIDADVYLDGASALYFPTIDAEKLWYIDQTVALTSSGGELTENFSDVYSGAYRHAYEGMGYVLRKTSGEECLLSDIGLYAESKAKCDWEKERELLRRILMNISIDVKFDKKDYMTAHNMAVKLANYCESETCGC